MFHIHTYKQNILYTHDTFNLSAPKFKWAFYKTFTRLTDDFCFNLQRHLSCKRQREVTVGSSVTAVTHWRVTKVWKIKGHGFYVQSGHSWLVSQSVLLTYSDISVYIKKGEYSFCVCIATVWLKHFKKGQKDRRKEPSRNLLALFYMAMNWQCFTHHTLWPQLNVRVSLCVHNILSSFEHEYISRLKIHRIILVSILYITFEFFNSVPLAFLLFPGMVCQFLKNLICTSFHWFFGLLRQHIAGKSLCCDGLQASINLQSLSLSLSVPVGRGVSCSRCRVDSERVSRVQRDPAATQRWHLWQISTRRVHQAEAVIRAGH